MRCVFALLATGCGRVDFGTRPGDAADDAPAARRCDDPAIPPATLTIHGTIFRYTSFTTTTPLAGASAELDVAGAPPASAIADGQGLYSLTVPTHSAPLPGKLVFGNPGDTTAFATTIWFDGPLTRDLVGAAPPYAWGADAPVWNRGAMGLVYNAAGVTEDSNAGSLNIHPTDCAGNAVAGVSVTLTPPPGELDYLNANGQPDHTLTATADPYPFAFAANAVAGPTHVTFSGGGLRWPELDIDVQAGSNNTIVVARGD